MQPGSATSAACAGGSLALLGLAGYLALIGVAIGARTPAWAGRWACCLLSLVIFGLLVSYACEQLEHTRQPGA